LVSKVMEEAWIFLGARIRHFAEKKVPATWSRNFLEILQKNPHISRKKFMKWPSFLAILYINPGPKIEIPHLENHVLKVFKFRSWKPRV